MSLISMSPEGQGEMQTPPDFIRIRSSTLRNILFYQLPVLSALVATIFGILKEEYVWVSVSVVVLFLTFKRWISSETIVFNEEGLYVPDFWFMKRFIPWKEVNDVRVDEENKIILIYLDTSWWRIVDTGMEDIVIALDSEQYELEDFEAISHHLKRLWVRNKATPDTLNQRILRQVDLAWNYRNRRVFAEAFNMVTANYLLWITIDLFYYALTGDGMGWIPHAIFLSLLILYAFLIQLAEKPRAIIAVRPHELGAVFYNGEEIVSNIRFIVMTEPYEIELKKCEIIYGEDQITQVSSFIQIHPKVVPRGELTHAVAQIGGNHTKAKGAIITMKLVGDNKDFEIPIYWN